MKQALHLEKKRQNRRSRALHPAERSGEQGIAPCERKRKIGRCTQLEEEEESRALHPFGQKRQNRRSRALHPAERSGEQGIAPCERKRKIGRCTQLEEEEESRALHPVGKKKTTDKQ